MKNFVKIIILCLAVSCARVPEDNHYTLKHQGMEREYYFYEPEAYAPGRPLMFVLHGYTGKAKGYCTPMVDAALEAGYAVCLPQGGLDARGITCWNVGYIFQEGLETDDVDFICTLARKLQRKYSLDKSRTFMVGMSNGGEMCYYLSRVKPDVFAAFVPIAGLTMTWFADEYPYTKPVSLMEVHGTADKVSPWAGDHNDTDWGGYLSVPEALQSVVEAAGNPKEEVTPFNENVTLHSWHSDDAEILLYEVHGGDHSWSFKSMDTAAEVVAFCNRH